MLGAKNRFLNSVFGFLLLYKEVIMPRKARKLLETNHFHVMVQGINKNKIFNTDEKARKYIKFLYKFSKEYNINIITYCVMINHCHIILNCEKVYDMSEFMKKVNINYAIYYNKNLNRVGYVFRDRYKSQGIFTENQLYKCINYVYNNPVKAEICDLPKDYPYLLYREDIYNIEYMDEDDFEVIEDDDVEKKTEAELKYIITEYISERNLNISKDPNNLLEVVNFLKSIESNISYRKLEIVLGIGRKKIKYWESKKLCKCPTGTVPMGQNKNV